MLPTPLVQRTARSSAARFVSAALLCLLLAACGGGGGGGGDTEGTLAFAPERIPDGTKGAVIKP